MSSDSLLPIAKLLLPEVLVSHFELTKHNLKGDELHFCFTELNDTRAEFNRGSRRIKTKSCGTLILGKNIRESKKEKVYVPNTSKLSSKGLN